MKPPLAVRGTPPPGGCAQTQNHHRAGPALLLAFLLHAGALAAQDARPLAVRFDPDAGTAVVTVGPVLSARELTDAVTSGVPIRLRLRSELWRDGFTDKLVESTALTIVIVHEPLSGRFFVRSSAGDQRSRAFDTFEAARAAVEREYPVRTVTRRPARYYYTATLAIETFSLSDLEELERWLQGDISPWPFKLGDMRSAPTAMSCMSMLGGMDWLQE